VHLACDPAGDQEPRDDRERDQRDSRYPSSPLHAAGILSPQVGQAEDLGCAAEAGGDAEALAHASGFAATLRPNPSDGATMMRPTLKAWRATESAGQEPADGGWRQLNPSETDIKVGATAISLARLVPMIAAAPGPAERLADHARRPGRDARACGVEDLRLETDVAERLGTGHDQFRQFLALIPPHSDGEGFAHRVDQDVSPFDRGHFMGSYDPEVAFVQGNSFRQMIR